MNTIDYVNLRENKAHVNPVFPYNTYLCSIPMDFTVVTTHWHDEAELIVIKKGTGIISVDMEVHIVKEHDIIFVRPGQLHAIMQYRQECMEYENILFDTALLYSQHQDLCTYEYFRPYFEMEYEYPWHIDASFSYHHALYACIERIDLLCDERKPFYELSLKSLLFELFYIFFSEQENLQRAIRKKSIEKVKLLIQFIQEHYQDTLSLHEAASYLGFSDSHFMKFFKQNMNTTFTNYLNEYRITIAGRLLLTTEDSILEIAEKTGFNNLSYFNRLFKKQFHQTPSEYRSKK